VYTLDPTCYTDAERPLVRQRVTPVLRQEQEWLTVQRLRVMMETGSGLSHGPIEGVNPQVSLEVSRDGGHVWENARFASAHRQGGYGETVEWRRLGRARQWTFRVSVSDPVPVAFIGASLA
jgi:hypothetical protein